MGQSPEVKSCATVAGFFGCFGACRRRSRPATSRGPRGEYARARSTPYCAPRSGLRRQAQRHRSRRSPANTDR